MQNLRKYSSFIKLEHTLFSLPLIFAGALLAEPRWPSLRTSLLILFAAGGARVVAMSLNRIFDRHIDRENPRTKERHLATGAMTVVDAWIVVAVSLAVYLYATWLISPFCLKLSWIPVVGFTVYPFFKRFTRWTHVGLGLVWSMVPLAGFFAVKGSAEGVAPVALLALFSVFWVAGFDIIYAVADEEFDREAGVHSLPAAWGSTRALVLAAVFHLLAFVMLFVLYFAWLSGPLTVMLLAVVGGLLFFEQYFARSVNLAFFQINVAIGFMVLFFILSGVKGV